MNRKLEIANFDRYGTASEFQTRFGGQPDWLQDPQWPISAGWDGRPMMFICQIRLQKEVFGNDQDRMAYLFITHKESPESDFFDPDIIFPDGGENAVIIQPNGDISVDVIKKAVGPTLFTNQGREFVGSPTLIMGEDPIFIDSTTYRTLSEERQIEYFNQIDGNKIGGTPNFFQDDEIPYNGNSMLLLQLHTNSLPFYLEIGASPTLFAFVSNELDKGCILIQDS